MPNCSPVLPDLTHTITQCGLSQVRGKLDRLSHHNVFLSSQWQRSWQRATGPDSLLPRPNFYVHAPCRTDPSAAPPGCDSIMVLLPVANMQQVGWDQAALGARSISWEGYRGAQL